MAEVGFVAGVTGLTGWWAAAATFAVNFAIAVQVNRFFGEKPPTQTDQGTRQQIPPNTANALPIVYGDAYLGGTFIDAALTTDQKTMYYVLAVSCISSNGTFTFDTSNMYYGDRLITFGSGATVASLSDQAIPTNVDTTINGKLEIYLYKSNAAGVITPVNTSTMPSTVMGSGSGLASAFQWTGTRQMNGLAFAIVKLGYSREAQTTSMQPITFKVTQNLSGLDRARPGDVWYDYITSTSYGGAVPAAYVDTTTRDALNTYSDQTITYTPSGGGTATQRRYKINGVVNAGETVLSNIDKILTACDSWMAYAPPTGKWSIVINKSESTAYAFTDNNIIGELRVSATDITSSINIVESKFPNKGNKDQTAYINLDLAVLNPSLLYPNEPVNKASISLDLVNDNVQASYLSNRILEQSREDLIVSFSTNYYGIQADAGDVISITNSGYGWTNKLFRVIRVNEISMPDGTLGAKIDATEYNSQVYDDASITAFTPVANSGLPSPQYFSALSAPTVTGSATATVPNFSVTVTLPTTGRVTMINLYYTTATTPTSSDWKLLDSANQSNSVPFVAGGTYIFSNEVLPAGTYLFAYSVINENSQSALSTQSASFVWAPDSNIRSGEAIVYRWATTIPTISGTSTYTWATGDVSSPPTGWFSTISDTGTASQTLWAAKVTLTGSVTSSTSTVNWTAASIYPFGYVGSTGASTRIAYTATSITLDTTPDVSTVSGDNLPATGTWGTGIVWSATVPALTSGQSVWQSDGVYNPTNNQTIWEVPYLSALKVGNLAAVSTNTGSLTVSGTFRSNTAAISGSTMTGSGAVIYNTGNFAVGDAYNNITYSGGVINLNGNFVSPSTFIAGNMTTGTAAIAQLQFGQSGVVISTNLKSAFNVRKVTADTTVINIAAQNNVDGNVTMWGHSAGQTLGNGNGVAGSYTSANTFSSWQLIGALGSGLRSAAVWGSADNSASGTVGGFFERSVSNTQISLATNNYSITSPSGGGKYYIADGSGPFTGYHQALFPIDEETVLGDIVVDCNVFYKDGISNVLMTSTKSSSANEVCIGVVSQVALIEVNQPPILWETIKVPNPDPEGLAPLLEVVLKPQFNLEELQSTYKIVDINALGEGQINVCGQNGDINKGDLIVASNIAGKGMKQADDIIRSYTVAKARESVTFDDPTEVKMIACIYVSG